MRPNLESKLGQLISAVNAYPCFSERDKAEYASVFAKLSKSSNGEHEGFVTCTYFHKSYRPTVDSCLSVAQLDVICQRAGLPGAAFKKLW